MRFTPLGDRAVSIALGDAIDEPTYRAVRAATARIAGAAHPAIVDIVPAYASVTVHYDPLLLVGDDARAAPSPPSPQSTMYGRCVALLRDIVDGAGDAPAADGATVEISVVYGGDDGVDLAAVAATHGLAPAEVVRRHTAVEYRVHMIGFAPGFAYLGGLDPTLATPRRATPRTRVPAGSVAIGGAQTGVYPVDSPGGWHVIGRTSAVMFDARRTPPSLLAVGDRVRFRALDASDVRPA